MGQVLHGSARNGKAERCIQTALREWAYARSYLNSAEQTQMLGAWIPGLQLPPPPLLASTSNRQPRTQCVRKRRASGSRSRIRLNFARARMRLPDSERSSSLGGVPEDASLDGWLFPALVADVPVDCLRLPGRKGRPTAVCLDTTYQ